MTRLSDTDLRALATEASAARDYATLALCLLALGVHRGDMRPHIAAACPPDVCAVVALRMLRAAQDQLPR
jgi:hypothetical protein